jgi:bifunctional NMN adenylyltransferase/nudix hydrolase
MVYLGKLSRTPAKEYDFLVFIGRFQPYHKGHEIVIETASRLAHNVIILIGSSNQPRNWRNPFTFTERKNMILSDWNEKRQLSGAKIHIFPIDDIMYNDHEWIRTVQTTVNTAIQLTDNSDKKPTIGLIGHSKDQSGFYLSLFPQWKNESVVPYRTQGDILDATKIRELFFLRPQEFVDKAEFLLSFSTFMFLQKFKNSEDYRKLVEEHEHIKVYREDHQFRRNLPYSPIHITVDAIVVQSGHVLMVTRGANPGKGLMALPGGFIHEKETLEESMLKILKKETKIKVPIPVLRGNIVKSNVFDDPYRSARGRVITHAFLIELPPDSNGLPKVKGGFDSTSSFWLPLSEVNATNMFEDHAHIIWKMIGKT